MIFEKTLIDNSKIRPFKGLMFETALNCTSCNKNYCKLSNICYARRDAKQHKKHLDNTTAAADNLNKICNNQDLFKKFVQYITIQDFKVIRFNLVGDFKTEKNIKDLINLATAAPQIKFYGYSKRHDLKDLLATAAAIDNIYLNSDLKKIYNINNVNQYKIHTNIKNYYNSSNKCGGSCSGCGYCYTLKNNQINTFIHSTPSHLQRFIKNEKNINFLLDLINNKLNLNVTIDDIGGGFLVKSFIQLLNNQGVTTPYKTTSNGTKKELIKTVPDLLKFIDLKSAGL